MRQFDNMNNTPLKVESIRQRNESDTQDLTLLLENFKLKEDHKAKQHQDDSLGGACTSEGDSAPSTPNRTHDSSYETEETSPAITSFSSTFDSPLGPAPIPFWYNQATPIPSLDERDDSFSNASAITTWDEEYDKAKAVYKYQTDLEGLTSHEEARKPDQPFDQNCDEKSPEFEPYYSPPRLPSPLKSRPRHVFITSCYQCILANMHCSRTLPACSRCERNGYSDVCLLHRRKLAREMTEDVETNKTPVLLRVEGMDEEMMWIKKLELSYEFQQFYLDQQDRNNRTLPSANGTRGGYLKSRQRRQCTHPGEGIGRPTFHTLTLSEVDLAIPATPPDSDLFGKMSQIEHEHFNSKG